MRLRRLRLDYDRSYGSLQRDSFSSLRLCRETTFLHCAQDRGELGRCMSLHHARHLQTEFVWESSRSFGVILHGQGKGEGPAQKPKSPSWLRSLIYGTWCGLWYEKWRAYMIALVGARLGSYQSMHMDSKWP